MKNLHFYVKDYPRPQLVRDNFTLLNGEWDFAFDDENNGLKEKWYSDKKSGWNTITVPFTYETSLSGIKDEKFHPVVWYGKTVDIKDEDLKKRKVLLHFEGVDFAAKVYVNGEAVGDHRGGYARFSFDITDKLLVGENRITVRVEDNYDWSKPRGKQRWIKDNFGCWYVQTTGIWKSVWMESVGEDYIKALKITPNRTSGTVIIEADISCDYFCSDLSLKADITFDEERTGIASSTVNVACGKARMEISLSRPDIFEWAIYEWSPEYPSLYDIEFTLFKNKTEVMDCVGSYFGMREVKIDKGNIILNGAPIYQRLILDQGYWHDSHLTPPSEEALIKDIDSVMAMGYNGVRKHQKTEDERFLYWCDVKGLLVWSEMAAGYALNDEAVNEFTSEWMEIVRQNYSHPSIITWTPFNETWGLGGIKFNKTPQHFSESIYHLTKVFDPMRPVIVNDGWEHTVSDIITLHDYEEKGDVFFKRYFENFDRIMTGEVYHCGHRSAFAEGYGYKGQPIIISEFGGIAFNEEGGWGYGNKVKDKDDFIRRFDDITTAIKKLPYVCGYCYTQVSDVQQEINGLMDEERNFKIDPEILKEINERRV
ncbi:MAG: glycoside hydrolase family 2 [Acetatifactor sp.]|nr:glycoside hydrolase family 2 [Acetatifactor sp.]